MGLLVLFLVTDVPREEQRSLWRIVAEELPKTLSEISKTLTEMKGKLVQRF